MIGLSSEGESGDVSEVKAKQIASTKKLMDDLNRQYEVCRLITHRDQFKGSGLGYGLSALASNKLPGL
eukprot:m.23581 g.23581  ORF g.23581 m.23581 type:complete len:68 (+) comp28503_c0_seq2:706-909(+)